MSDTAKSSLIAQADIVHLLVLQAHVKQLRHEIREEQKQVSQLKARIMEAHLLGVPVEDGPHTLWLEQVMKLEIA